MKLLIAGGGTGGHVFPGIAIAQALQQISPESQVLFVGTQRGIEKTAIPSAGFDIEFIEVRGLKGHSIKNILTSLFMLPKAFLHSIRILQRHRIDAVIGIGGYASGPVLLAAWLMRIPIAICEPNSIPGFTNKLLGLLSRRIFGGFQKTGAYFPKNRFRWTGNPLRSGFLPRELVRKSKPLVVVIGGSLGARVFNEVIPHAIAILRDQHIEFDVLHQTGKHNEMTTREQYQKLGIDADVRPFIDDMLSVYQQADLIIARSGAASCAEIAAVGVASILVPFPYAIYDHQTENAKELVSAHAAILLPQDQMTANRLANEIQSLLFNEKWRHEMAQEAKKLGKLDAATQIAQSALGLFHD